jgi:hypothetical protein
MTSAAFAQRSLTFVSGSGIDSNPCVRVAPCRTFAAGFAQVASDGVLLCIDSAGYGALTITYSVVITCDGVEAGVRVNGTNGFVIDAGPNGDVFLSGIDFDGLAPASSSLNGILILSARQVIIRNCRIRSFWSGDGVNGNGIFVNNSGSTAVFVIDTVISDNAHSGIEVQPRNGATATVSVTRSSATSNGAGMRANNSLNAAAVGMTVTSSVVANNVGAGFSAISSSGYARLHLTDDAIVLNGTGIVSMNALARVDVGRSTIMGNVFAASATGGTINSYGTNQIDGNLNDAVLPVIPSH